MTEEFEPQLSQDAAAALPGPPEDSFPEWTRPPYGEPLLQAVARTPVDWLESAVLAGHLPTPDGLALAAHALFLHHQKDLEAVEAMGCYGDAEFTAAVAGLWRDLAVTAEGCVARMEEHAARSARQPTTGVEDSALAQQRAFDAGAAERRAARARDRARSAARDSEEADDAWRRYR